MVILDVPDHVDHSTIRPNGDWPLSARCGREHALRDQMVAEARDMLDLLSDRELRVKAAAELDADLRHMGGGDPPRGFPNAFAMPRDELLDFLAGRTVMFEPYIEVVYPGAVDPTA